MSQAYKYTRHQESVVMIFSGSKALTKTNMNLVNRTKLLKTREEQRGAKIYKSAETDQTNPTVISKSRTAT